MRSERLSLDCLTGTDPGTMLCEELLPGEIEGVRTELVSIKGPHRTREPADADACTVLIGLAGGGTVAAGGAVFDLVAESIARLPYAEEYEIDVAEGEEIRLLRIVKALDATDKAVVADRPDCAAPDGKRFADCPTYLEGIKSAKTINRTLLREGIIPRFCLGSVETTGPDAVASHEHPMLEQLFLGLRDCRCTVFADDASALLTGNTLLHVPLGSNHSVTVAEGDTLYYLWFDFFETQEGLSWIRDQHVVDEA